MRCIFLLLIVALFDLICCDLTVCRNLQLDQLRTSVSSETTILEFPIGDQNPSASGDTDVSALLDPSDTSRFLPDVRLELTAASADPTARLARIDYKDENGNGLAMDLSSDDVYNEYVEVVDQIEGKFAITIPSSSYLNQDLATWTDMRSVTLTFTTPQQGSLLVTELLRLCSYKQSPSFCSIPTSDIYQTNCNKCNCQVRPNDERSGELAATS